MAGEYLQVIDFLLLRCAEKDQEIARLAAELKALKAPKAPQNGEGPEKGDSTPLTPA